MFSKKYECDLGSPTSNNVPIVLGFMPMFWLTWLKQDYIKTNKGKCHLLITSDQT